MRLVLTISLFIFSEIAYASSCRRAAPLGTYDDIVRVRGTAIDTKFLKGAKLRTRFAVTEDYSGLGNDIWIEHYDPNGQVDGQDIIFMHGGATFFELGESAYLLLWDNDGTYHHGPCVTDDSEARTRKWVATGVDDHYSAKSVCGRPITDFLDSQYNANSTEIHDLAQSPGCRSELLSIAESDSGAMWGLGDLLVSSACFNKVEAAGQGVECWSADTENEYAACEIKEFEKELDIWEGCKAELPDVSDKKEVP